ncbi:MAG: hypothetical protein CVU69_02840 [Deltaproteobacteria bacterium HGW-Deltaproteobacteria-4]|nr:MAG: hypothetical protein CVU69_02840 [Deltaproteobacteria bacterium HGW-Deltaproteobacteria-4]
MHDGNPKAKPIKGLCNHLIDLSQDNSKLLADIHATLKLFLGAQWQQFYVLPKENVPDIMPTLDGPEGQRVNADSFSFEEYSFSNREEIFDNDDQLPETVESEASTEAPWLFTTSALDQLKKVIARKKYQVIALAVILGLIGVGWYLFKLTSHPEKTVVKESTQSNTPAPVAVAPLAQDISSTQRPKTDVLPSFIPLAGHDQAFALQNPGWERYVGTGSEFRVFLSNGKIKAVQMLATNGHVISESRLKTILIELTGTDEYSISSHEQQFGFQVSRATVTPKSDLLIYRKESAVHAFVVSLD